MMNIKETFIKLTERTYPHGTESEIFPLLNSELNKDEFGNLFLNIGESDVMFTSHLDTATSTNSKVNHVFCDDIIKTDGTTILGADDKAGVTIMLYMIENKIPGLYYFFLGEEVGCIGSKKLADVHKKSKIDGINKVISFDRRGYDSVITFQSSQRCCSDSFGEALSEQLNLAETSFDYKKDTTGLLTDSIQFISIYPECTNISVGYKSEHTCSEQQDIKHLIKLAEACLLVDWKSLPVQRDPSKTEYKSYGSYGNSYGNSYSNSYGWSGYDDYDYDSFSAGYRELKEPATTKKWFFDKENNYMSSLEIERLTGKVISVDLSSSRIETEKDIIMSLLNSLELNYESLSWNGYTLKISYNQHTLQHTTYCNRNDLLEYLPELDYSKDDDLDNQQINISYQMEIDK